MLKTLAPVMSLLLGISFLLAGNGLQTTLTPLRAALEDFSALQIGLMGSGYYAGFVAGCLVGPYLILRAGHIRAFTALVAAASAIALVHPIAVDPIAWIACRAVTGFSLAGLYLIVESWLNDRATNANRGFLMSAYIIVNYVAITAGQMMVTLAPLDTFNLFALASILVSVAAIPVALTRSAQPAPITLVRFNPLKLYRMAPVAIVGSLMIGMANGAFWSLGTVFASQRGLGTDGVAMFMSAAVVGGALGQWPVGRISDRMDRRFVLVGVLAVSAVVAVLLATLTLPGPMLMAMGFVFGLTTLPAYSVAAAHAYDRASPDSYVETAAAILLANGVGSVIGPLAASLAMDQMGSAALFFYIAAVEVLLLLFVVLRVAVRTRPSAVERTGFDVYSTAPVGGPLTPDAFEDSHPMVAVPPEPLRADNDARKTGAAA
ncbi:MFS transporter [Methylobrevis albus]|uniref:MFS transporter n=1 Tax=Methylobrevis albus TaxID=2793297 RepID=UPI001F30611D|nr:MFS transporter [Methylobrevis albus]